MNSLELLNKIKSDVNYAKENRTEAIPVNNLLAYLDGIDLTDNGEENHIVLEGLKHQNSTELEILKINNSFQIESFKAVINIGANACRTFLIMNGGAAIALLAFLGNIWNKDSTTQASQAIASALLWFCSGVILAGLCAAFSYISQSLYTSSELGEKKIVTWIGHATNIFACTCGLGSIFIFAYGSFSTYQSMVAQLVK